MIVDYKKVKHKTSKIYFKFNLFFQIKLNIGISSYVVLQKLPDY